MRIRSSTTIKTFALILLFSLTSLPIFASTTGPGPVIARPGPHVAEGAGQIEDVSYVWQELNGYCYWAANTMALEYMGIPSLDLRQFFAISGIGASMAYVRVESSMSLVSGAWFRQQQYMPMFNELFNVNHSVYMDDSSNFGALFHELNIGVGVNVLPVDGKIDAFRILRNTIDEGYPVVIFADPYYLPPVDYDIIRELGIIHYTDSPFVGHAILAVGYNNTEGTVQIMDPGVGAFGELYGYPDDGRWQYSMNYSNFADTWEAFGYAMTVFKHSSNPQVDFETRLAEYIIQRLAGDRESYLPDTGELFFAMCGESAFRGLGVDFNVEGLKSYLAEFESWTEMRVALIVLGLSIQQSMTMQYPAFKSTIETLPELLPSLDLTDFSSAANEALPHMDILANNASLLELGYIGDDNDLLMSTIFAIIDSYDSTSDMDGALEESSADLEIIAEHLLAIADSWEAAGNALEIALSRTQPLDIVPIGVVGGIVVFLIAIVIVRRRSS